MFIHLKYKDIGLYVKGAKWLASLQIKLLLADRKTISSPICPNSEAKEEVLGRADWLAQQILVSPQQLLDKMPSMLGKKYGGEWAIYSCSFYAAALFNICAAYPEKKEICLDRMERLIKIINTAELRGYDTRAFHEDALESLEGPKSHMTYLSILAWVISFFRLSGGHAGYDDLYKACCKSLSRRMLAREDLCLPSFPNGIVFLPDILVAVVALHNYSKLFDNRYANLVGMWMDKAKTEWIEPRTGLIVATLKRNGRKGSVRGSYSALNCYYLSLIDEDFAREQYDLMKASLWIDTQFHGIPVSGIREYLNRTPKLNFDPDAGPIVCGISASGTAWALGCATLFGDEETRNDILRMAELVGTTVKRKGTSHYLLGEIVLVGEAVALAMRTHKKYNTNKDKTDGK